MSQDNVEVVRRLYFEGWLDAADAPPHLIGAGVEYVNPLDAIDAGVRRGPEFADALRSLAETFPDREHRLLRTYDAGDSVVADVMFRGRGVASGAEVQQREAHTWTFHDGQLLRFEWGRDLAAALKAVGLGE
jgi:ketosteroid isomerase-like protein